MYKQPNHDPLKGWGSNLLTPVFLFFIYGNNCDNNVNDNIIQRYKFTKIICSNIITHKDSTGTYCIEQKEKRVDDVLTIKIKTAATKKNKEKN